MRESFHDGIARIARREGNNPAEFHAAAQRHANATWFFLAIAGVVWYFANWMWAAIPGIIAIFVACKSVSSTIVATKLEKKP